MIVSECHPAKREQRTYRAWIFQLKVVNISFTVFRSQTLICYLKVSSINNKTTTETKQINMDIQHICTTVAPSIFFSEEFQQWNITIPETLTSFFLGRLYTGVQPQLFFSIFTQSQLLFAFFFLLETVGWGKSPQGEQSFIYIDQKPAHNIHIAKKEGKKHMILGKVNPNYS